MHTYTTTLIVLVLLVAGIFIYRNAGDEKLPVVQNEPATEVVRIAHAPGQFSMNFPLYVGREAGIFAHYGLEVHGEEMDSSIAIPALIGGSVDYIPYSREGAIAALHDVDVKFVTMISSNQFQYLLGRAGTATSSIRTMAVPTLHSASHYLALAAMDRGAFTAEIVEGGNSIPATRAMLMRDMADAAILSYLAPVDFESEGIAILDDLDGDALIMGLTTQSKTIAENPEQVTRVVNAFKDIAQYVKDSPEETKNLLFAYYGFTERTEAEARKVEQAYVAASTFFSSTGIPTETQKHHLIQTASVVQFDTLDAVRSYTVTDADIAQVFDLRFVE